MKKTYIQIDGKLVLKTRSNLRSDAPNVVGDIESFVSPITKEVIHSRRQLRAHNKEHGVTDSRDYSPEFMKKRSDQRINEMTGNNPQAKAERIECVKRTLEKFGL